MGERPNVSVVIPTYNRAAFLPAAIDSALSQSYPPCEILVVDDGSTDHTADVVAAYRARVRLIAQSNQGTAAGRNAGVAASSGAYVAFLDSDDLWLPHKLERQMERFAAHS